MTNARPGPADIAMSPAVRSTEIKLKISEWKDASSGSDASLEENCVRWDAAVTRVQWLVQCIETMRTYKIVETLDELDRPRT
jgi:hypothetical protein